MRHQVLTERAVLDSVNKHWWRLGVRRDQRREMSAELAGDLASATQEGHSLEAVVGSDLHRFAAEWAQARGAARTRPRATLVVLGVFIVQCVGAISVVVHDLRKPQEGGAGVVLGILLIQLCVYIGLGIGLWQNRRWAVWITSGVLALEAAVILLATLTTGDVSGSGILTMVLDLVGLAAVYMARPKRQHATA
jgi:hypothetical protein